VPWAPAEETPTISPTMLTKLTNAFCIGVLPPALAYAADLH
jgi:hypothetical protein